MKVFVTGATGFIGSAVVKELLGAGHQVTGLARSEASAAALSKAGARVQRGSLEDLESLRRGAAENEAAVHLAFFHQFTHANLSTRLRVLFGGAPSGIVSRFLGAALETDRRAIETIGRALRGPDRALAVAFGTMGMAPGVLATEDTVSDPNSVGGPRGASEYTVLTMAGLGVRATVLRLPPIVHGDGDKHGFTPLLIAAARKNRSAAYVGDGRNRWPSVHRLDAARLFRLALEKGEAGARYHAVADEGIPFIEIAQAFGEQLNVPVVGISVKEAMKRFSWVGMFAGVDNPASSALTRARLGWEPTQVGLLGDIRAGEYFKE